MSKIFPQKESVKHDWTWLWNKRQEEHITLSETCKGTDLGFYLKHDLYFAAK